MAILMDSGERREFESGAVRDIQEGKGRCDLLPLYSLTEYYRKYKEGVDLVINAIASFMNTGHPSYLISAMEFFRRMRGGWEKPETMFLEMAIHFEDGARKYGERNWENGIPVHCYIDSGLRHYLKWKRGDTDEPHDRAFCWNMACAYWTCVELPELNEYCTDDELD